MAHILSIVFLAVLATCASTERSPPPPTQSVLMARYIANEAIWTSIATISVNEKFKGYPFSNLKSYSDGAIGEGTGTPYILQTPLDFTGKDIEVDSRATFMMTLAQGEFCKSQKYDPMDPRCGRLIMTGKIVKISKEDPEYVVGNEAFKKRHPLLPVLPADHGFYLAKLDIEHIVVLAYFGGAVYVDVDEYYKANATSIQNYTKLYK